MSRTTTTIFSIRRAKERVLQDVVATSHFALCPLAQVSAHRLVISFWMREENRQTVDVLAGFALQQRQGQRLAAAAQFPQKNLTCSLLLWRAELAIYRLIAHPVINVAGQATVTLSYSYVEQTRRRFWSTSTALRVTFVHHNFKI